MSSLALFGCPDLPDQAAPARVRMRTEVGNDQERVLLAAARGGQLAAFEALYRLSVKRLAGLCRRLCADRDQADELVQEVFVRAWSHLHAFREESSFASWLAKVAVHLFLDERRARRRRSEVTGALSTEGGEQACAPVMPEARYDLERALRALPPRARAVFVLHDIEGHRHDEVAALMGVDAGTSKSQLHRARRLLREALR